MKPFSRVAVVVLSMAVLSGCSYQNPNAPPDVTSRGDTPQMQVATAAGLDVPQAVSARNDAELGQAANAALTATAMINPIPGISPGGALGMGLIGFLASPPAGPEASDQMIAVLELGADPEAMERIIQKAAYRLAGPSLSRKGFIPVDDPTAPGMQLYIQQGCELNRRGVYDRSCMEGYTPVLMKRGIAGGKQVYLVNAYSSDFMRQFAPAPYWDNRYDPRLLRQIADTDRQRIVLYFAPRKLDGAWTRAALYTGGQLLPL